MDWLKVKKWWWENAWELKKSPWNISNDFDLWNKQLVVVSAIRSSKFNTTDNLIDLSNLLTISRELSYGKLEEIKQFHIKVLRDKLWTNYPDLEKKISDYFDTNLFRPVIDWFDNDDDESKIYPSKNNDYSIWFWYDIISIIWFWENLSAFIQTKIINSLDIPWLEAENVNLDWISDELSECKNGSEVFLKLSSRIKDIVLSIIEQWKIPIIPWYIPGFDNWIENVIWRWYSDATASITSVWLSKYYDVTLEIQKSVRWMLSIDPRLLYEWEAKLIERLDYVTAKEITWIRWSQAKLLHSQVLRKELLEAWVQVKLFNPFDESNGTIISKDKDKNSNWVEYIWVRDNIIFFSISSCNMSDSWILSWIFDIVRDYWISVDIVSTSETEITFTIDGNINDEVLNKLSNAIREKLDIEEEDNINFVKYNKNKALIFCVGQNLSHTLWILSRASSVFKRWGINIELVSQWSMERSMIFGIDISSMRNAVNLLHKEFIEN